MLLVVCGIADHADNQYHELNVNDSYHYGMAQPEGAQDELKFRLRRIQALP